MTLWKQILAVGALTVGLAATPATAGQLGLDRLRAQLMRLQIRLQYEAENAPSVREAHQLACAAYTEMYKCREEVLTRLYQTAEYKDLRLALYHTQRKLSGYQEEIPSRIQRIMEGATSALAVRVQITRLEAAALDANESFVQARNQANAMYAAYRQALREALTGVQTNPELVSLVDQIASARRSVTGMRSSVKPRS